MFQNIADNVWQVFLRHDFLLVTQFGNTLRNTTSLLWSQVQSKFFQILRDIGPTRILTQSIFPFTTKALRHQLVIIEFVFRVTIGMDPSYLGEDILTNNRLIGSHSNSTEAFHHPRDIVQLAFYDVGLGMELVLQNNLY